MWQSRGVPGPLPLLLLLPKPSACHEQSPSRHPRTRHPRAATSPRAGQAHPCVLCRPHLLRFHLLLYTPSTWSIPLRLRTGTDSCLDTLFTHPHTKNLAVFPTKAACLSWRHQQLVPAVPGCSSKSLSVARVTQTAHTGPVSQDKSGKCRTGRESIGWRSHRDAQGWIIQPGPAVPQPHRDNPTFRWVPGGKIQQQLGMSMQGWR